MEKLLSILKDIKSDVDFEKETELVDAGILDSLDIVAIIDAIEESFGLEVDPDNIDPDNFQSADTIWAMIQRLSPKT
ncbi:MAG: acyl carrier protein [Stomatobaculum sp.]